jgi:hypothetical protein
MVGEPRHRATGPSVPKMMEDPSNLQGGRRPFRGVGSKLAEALIVFVVSIPVAIVVPYLFIQLVASAQNACFDVDVADQRNLPRADH